jgi:hypothetical protein
MPGPNTLRSVVAAISVSTCLTVSAGWQDMLKSATDMAKPVASGTAGGGSTAALAGVSQSEASQGLQQALVQGVEKVVAQLGAADGYLANPKVRIPMPKQLNAVEQGLRMMGQDKYADQFVETMNRAAEQAVSEAQPVFVDAITNMSFDDALGIAQGGDDAATQYLKRSTGPALRERMLPIVKSATESNQVTSAYKSLAGQAGSLGPLASMVDMSAADLDGYVTDRALDGLYKVLAEQEKTIRSNPTAWTTDIMKKVFGSL